MYVLKHIHGWGFLGIVLQLSVYLLYYILFRIKTYDQIFLTIGALLAFCVLAIGHRKTRVEKKTEALRQTSSASAQQAVKILSSLYAVIAGLSLTTAIKAISSLENVFFGVGNITAFLFTALPFYNGATMFLITNYYLTGFEGKRTEALVDFSMLFAEALALYGMAISIINLLGFIISLLILLLANTFWVIFILARKPRREVPLEWLWLDFYMFIFLPLFFFSSEPSTIALSIVAISRTITDYYVACKFYLPP